MEKSQLKERTLVVLKPDTVQRGFIGRILERFETRGLKIVGMKMIQVDRELAEKHYAEHKGKDFYEALLNYIVRAPVVVVAIQGKNSVRLVRNMIGALKPEEAMPGSIRGDFGVSKTYNVIHGSDSPENGLREIGLYFSDEELFDYQRGVEDWMRHED